MLHTSQANAHRRQIFAFYDDFTYLIVEKLNLNFNVSKPRTVPNPRPRTWHSVPRPRTCSFMVKAKNCVCVHISLYCGSTVLRTDKCVVDNSEVTYFKPHYWNVWLVAGIPFWYLTSHQVSWSVQHGSPDVWAQWVYWEWLGKKGWVLYSSNTNDSTQRVQTSTTVNLVQIWSQYPDTDPDFGSGWLPKFNGDFVQSHICGKIFMKIR